MRTTKTGGTRSNASKKISYLGFRHPLTEHSYGSYMLKHQVQEDGKIRQPDNWWKGLDPNDTIQSLVRHVTDLEALHSNLLVYKVRYKEKGEVEEETVILPYTYEKVFKKPLPKNWTKTTQEDAGNAAKFNINSYLLNLLKEQYDKVK